MLCKLFKIVFGRFYDETGGDKAGSLPLKRGRFSRARHITNVGKEERSSGSVARRSAMPAMTRRR